MSKNCFLNQSIKNFRTAILSWLAMAILFLPIKQIFDSCKDLSVAIVNGGNSVNITEVQGNKSIFVKGSSNKTTWKGCTALRYHPWEL